ncbi:MAG: hypothetical protein ACREXK_08440, partial [Gammaproteobacteria bacterium]
GMHASVDRSNARKSAWTGLRLIGEVVTHTPVRRHACHDDALSDQPCQRVINKIRRYGRSAEPPFAYASQRVGSLWTL